MYAFERLKHFLSFPLPPTNGCFLLKHVSPFGLHSKNVLMLRDQKKPLQPTADMKGIWNMYVSGAVDTNDGFIFCF